MPSPAGPRQSAAISIFLALAVLCGQTYMVASQGFTTILVTPFLPYSLIGAFAIHFWTRPARAERWWTLTLALLGIILFIGWSGHYRFDWASSVACGSFAGLASLSVLAVQVMRLRGPAQKDKLDTLIAGSVLGYSALFIAFILNWTTQLHPQTYDLYLYAADAGFGLPLLTWTARLVHQQRMLGHTCLLVYETLPLAVSLLYAYQRSGERKLPVRVLPAFLGGGAAAYVLYNILPATGPCYVFGGAFPYHLPTPAEAGLHLIPVADAPRNAVPSMHLACALLILWACRPLAPWIRTAAALFLTLTVLATVGLGEHYVVDLVTAVPYAVALQAASMRQWRAAATTAGLTMAWVLVLRFGTFLFQSTVFTWTVSVATLAVCLLLQRSLMRFCGAGLPACKLALASPGSATAPLASAASS